MINESTKPTIIGVYHVLESEKCNLKAITDYLETHIPEDRRIGCEITPLQLAIVESTSDKFSIEFLRRIKEFDLQLVSTDDDNLRNRHKEAIKKIIYHFTETGETSKRLVTELYLASLERSASMGYQIKKKGLELSFVGNLHRMDLRNIF